MEENVSECCDLKLNKQSPNKKTNSINAVVMLQSKTKNQNQAAVKFYNALLMQLS